MSSLHHNSKCCLPVIDKFYFLLPAPNFVSMAFSLTWGWGAPPPSKGKGHGNEVFRLLISRTPLNLNIDESNNKVFVKMSFQDQNTSPTKSLFTSFLQHVLHLFHMILKFSLHSWQVPRSSVGRALYRESGPSQDGDPVPGNLPFFSLLFFFFFSKIRFLSYFISRYEIMWSVFVCSPFLLQYNREGFVPLISKVSLFLLNSGHASERC